MYFKLLKFVIGFFVFCVILESYLMYQYSDGKIDNGFTAVSLGNLAFSYFQCKSSNLKERSDIYLNCQKGALINELKEFGLQSSQAKEGDNVCPVVGDENTPILLEDL